MLALVLALLALLQAPPAAVRAGAGLPPAAARGERIKQALEDGEVADLEKLFSEQQGRVIDAAFLRDLLTGGADGFRPHLHGLKIRRAIIEGDLDLGNADVPYDVALIECQFNQGVDFHQSTFKKSLSLEGSEFRGRVNFRYCNVGGGLDANSARFTSGEGWADFEGLRVGDDADFTKATFAGAANFNAVETGRDFQANLTKFRRANFESMKARNGMIRQAEFSGPAKFTGAEFTLSLELMGTKFKDCSEGPRFDDMKVGAVIFGADAFCEKYQESRGVSFEGMKFERIAIRYQPSKRDRHWSDEHLIDLARAAEFNAEFYSRLEDYLRRTGEPERADDVFLAYKRRERAERLNWPGYLGGWLLDALVAYGREPWRAFLYSALVFVMGCFVFHRREGMELQEKGQDSQRVYNPYWYSLDLLAPVIDLKASSAWAPKPERRFARNYVYVQRLLGWILIPIGVAALSGLLYAK